MGEITDRTLENLAPSDLMIAITRRRLLEAAQALRDTGTKPPVLDNPAVAARVRSGDLVAPEGQPWLDAYEEMLGEALHPGMARAAE
jgi:phthalate 4,5-dioxygenase oxygenase subunit